MARLSDSVAAQIMGELHVLTAKIEAQQERAEAVANLVIEAAELMNKSKTNLHRQNEVFLMDKVKEITAAVAEMRVMQTPIQDAARAQVAPLIEQMTVQVKALAEKDTYAMKFMLQTKDILEKTRKFQQTVVILAILSPIVVVVGVAAIRWLR